MNAFTFLCDNTTEKECLDRLLLGTNPGPVYDQTLRKVEVGDLLFLWNYVSGIFRGPFVALTRCMHGIEPNAWANNRQHPRGFPLQVRVVGNQEYHEPLTADDLNRRGLLHAANLGLMPPAQLGSHQVRQVLEMFRQKNGDMRPLVEVEGKSVFPGDENVLATAFIFKCDRATGGRCFADSIMGAPVQLFRDVVSNVQAGSMIFLWQIEERKLFGVWKATTRGQYDPTAFPESAGRAFHAVVHCARELNLTNGIDEAVVRGIVPYDGAIPPYKIDQPQAERLIDALLAANNEADAPFSERRLQEGFLAQDGHWVKSQAELIIDNMLFSQGHLHAYEKRIQIGRRYLRCDFYLPRTDRHREVYIEYWGMLDRPEYARRRQDKLAIYNAAQIVPLELFPKDIPILPEAWPPKFDQYGA